MRTLVLATVALTAVACSDQPTEPMLETEAALSVTPDLPAAAFRSYEVTIHNLTGGQPFTPPLAATHRRPAAFYQVGAPASFGIKEIAENGNLGPMSMALEGNRQVSDVVIAVGSPPPVLPGGSITFGIEAGPGAKYLSWVSMLICTNDGFAGLDAMRLPQNVGDEAGAYVEAYDAGTELNTEDFADMVPPCPGLTGVPSSDEGTGASNPALAENGVIHPHGGIVGDDDLDAELHGWAGPVAAVMVRRTG